MYRRYIKKLLIGYFSKKRQIILKITKDQLLTYFPLDVKIYLTEIGQINFKEYFMKKFLRVFLVLTMILGITACSSKQADKKETKVEKTEKKKIGRAHV